MSAGAAVSARANVAWPCYGEPAGEQIRVLANRRAPRTGLRTSNLKTKRRNFLRGENRRRDYRCAPPRGSSQIDRAAAGNNCLPDIGLRLPGRVANWPRSRDPSPRRKQPCFGSSRSQRCKRVAAGVRRPAFSSGRRPLHGRRRRSLGSSGPSGRLPCQRSRQRHHSCTAYITTFSPIRAASSRM